MLEISPESVVHDIFLITERGYLGLGHMTLEVGDIVCVLLGGNLPFILRMQENDEYRLAGKSYVHGLMDSEAMQGTGEKDFKNFVLVWSAKGHRVCHPRPRPQQEDPYRGAANWVL